MCLKICHTKISQHHFPEPFMVKCSTPNSTHRTTTLINSSRHFIWFVCRFISSMAKWRTRVNWATSKHSGQTFCVRIRGCALRAKKCLQDDLYCLVRNNASCYVAVGLTHAPFPKHAYLHPEKVLITHVQPIHLTEIIIMSLLHLHSTREAMLPGSTCLLHTKHTCTYMYTLYVHVHALTLFSPTKFLICPNVPNRNAFN